MTDVSEIFKKEFLKRKKLPPKPPYESPINEKKCKSCGMWESECICED